MAQAIRLNFMEHTFSAPGCFDLPARVEETGAGKLITTAWKLEPEVLASVAATGLVIVQMLHTVPPMMILGCKIEGPPGVKFALKLPDGPATICPDAHSALTLILDHLTKGAARLEIERLEPDEGKAG